MGSIKIETNLGGNIMIEGRRGDNSKGGRDIHILTKKDNKQMMKVDISTEKTVNDNQIKLVLRDSVEIDPDSMLYRKIVRNYRLLTPFNKRTGEFEFFVNKNEKNLLLNKFYVKGEVKKDTQTVMKALLTTNEKPSRCLSTCPLSSIRSTLTWTNTRSPSTTLPARCWRLRPTARSSRDSKLPRLAAATRESSRSTERSSAAETTPSPTTHSRPRSPLLTVTGSSPRSPGRENSPTTPVRLRSSS